MKFGGWGTAFKCAQPSLVRTDNCSQPLRNTVIQYCLIPLHKTSVQNLDSADPITLLPVILPELFSI